jgi:signal transduction histidine kinase
MHHSLRTQLLLICALVVAVAVGGVALLASRVSASELQRFVERDLERNQLLITTVMTQYDQQAGLKDAPSTVARLAAQLGERIVVVNEHGLVLADSDGAITGAVLRCGEAPAAIIVAVGARNCPFQRDDIITMQHEAVADVQSNVIFYSAALSGTAPLAIAPATRAPLIALGERDVLDLAAAPVAAGAAAISITRPTGGDTDPVVAGFLSAVNRSVLVAACAAGAAGLILSLALSRSVLRPVEALTHAARRMARGDIAQRVDVAARGEIGALAQAFNAMADGLARQEQLRRHMVTDVAHELRTPLTNIRGYLEAARDGVLPPDAAMLDSLHEEALLLNRLIDDLQDLALAEAGQLRLDRRPCAPATLVTSARAAALPHATERGIRLETRAAPDLPSIDVDPERVGQILRNLLNNGLMHTPHGGEITLTAARFSLQPSALIHFTVRDSGPGIAPEHLPLLFERFFRADSSRTRATGGAGLGLTIVRQLVEAHGGRVWAESSPGAGASFHFTLPIAS